MFGKLTGLKFETSFLLVLLLSNGITDAVLTFFRKKNLCNTRASDFRKKCSHKIDPRLFYILISEKIFDFSFIDRFDGKSFTIRKMRSIEY